MPALSVLIPVYNAQNTLSAAIWSVLNQDFTDFECIVYLDGPTDKSAEIVASFKDSRIKVLHGERQGIVHARNSLLMAAKGHFVAWLDADDIALPGRLGAQVSYLTTHPDLFMVGSWVEVRNNKKVKSVKWPTNPKTIDAWLFYRNPLVQSSVMFRKHNNEVTFQKEFEYLEDYYFYSQQIGKERIGMLPSVLCSYLEDSEPGRIATYLKYDFVGKLERIMLHNFNLLGLKPGTYDIALIRDFLRTGKPIKKEDGAVLFKFFKSAIRANGEKGLINASAFKAVTTFQILRLWKYCPRLKGRLTWYLALRIIPVLNAIKTRPRYAK